MPRHYSISLILISGEKSETGCQAGLSVHDKETDFAEKEHEFPGHG